MNSEDQFKDSLRNLVESKEFSFDEANWEKAAGLIRTEGESRNKFLWFGMAAILLITLGIFTYAYFVTPAAPVVAEKNMPAIETAIPATETPSEKATQERSVQATVPAKHGTSSSSSDITLPNAAKLH